jgi:DNA ligase 4
MEHLDLIILGGFYGDGRRGGLVSQFLLGVAKSPAIPGKHIYFKLWTVK